MGTLYYIKRGEMVYRGFKKHGATDTISLGLFVTALESKCKDQTHSALRQGVPALWDETYDVVNPYGDRRSIFYESVWVFDLDADILILHKDTGSTFVPLALAYRRELSMEDFSPLTLPFPSTTSSCNFLAPYWELRVSDMSREKSFIGRILQDFAHTWRHLLQRQQNQSTFLRLAAAIVWISSLDFTVVERTGFDHSPGGPYAWVIDLPQWPCPRSNFIEVRGSWFVLTEDPQEGLESIRRHFSQHTSDRAASEDKEIVYALLSLRQIILVRGKRAGKLEWTKPETIFDDKRALSDRSIDLLLWMTKLQTQPTSLGLIPVELQDRILYDASCSAVAAAKLGCELGLGSSFGWHDAGRQIYLENCKRKRTEYSPVESQIYLGQWMSAVSYKPSFEPTFVQRQQPTYAGSKGSQLISRTVSS